MKSYKDWKESYGLEFEPNYSTMTDRDCAAAFDAGSELSIEFLLHLVDVVWNECTESEEVPDTVWSKKMIEKALKKYEHH